MGMSVYRRIRGSLGAMIQRNKTDPGGLLDLSWLVDHLNPRTYSDRPLLPPNVIHPKLVREQRPS